MAEDQKRSHTLADHLLGQDVAHAHDGEADHDHDHFEVDADERLEENPIWIQDHVTLVTVGVDIGSSGTQVIFSRINLRRYGEDLTSRYYGGSRETLFQAPVGLAPHSSGERIDDAALGIVEKGNVIASAALHIGGRLQGIDASGRIVRLDPAGKFHARQAGFSWSRGDVVSAGQLDKVAANMAELLVAALTQRPLPPAVEHLYLTDPIRDLGRIDGLMFSAGVGGDSYARQRREFGDMGRRLGRAIRARIDSGALPWPLRPPGECIPPTPLPAPPHHVHLTPP